MSKRAIAVICLLAAASAAYAVNTPVAKCYLVPILSMVQIAPGVFVEPSMSVEQRRRLLADISSARTRIEGFLGSRKANPTYIAGSRSTLRRFGGPVGETALSHITPFSDFVVLGPAGQNVDVIAHETTHTELRARTGFLRRMVSVPTWFDEGMAMHVDYRPAFGEEVYQKRTSGGKTAPRLADIDTAGKFHRAPYAAYLTAKHEFDAWYAKAGRGELLEILDRVRDGGPVRPFSVR